MSIAACLLLPWTAPQAPCTGPMATLVSSHPYGHQLSAEVTPDGTRAFVAQGAVIAILDLNATPGSPAELIEEVRVPDCQPLAMRFFQDPAGGQRYLFIAGGSHGLWRLTLCSCLFGPSPSRCTAPTSCLSADPYDPIRISIVEGGNFERKRCVDVEVLEGELGVPVLFALYAASSDPQQSGIGPTELRAYTLGGGSVTALASLTFDATLPGGTPRSVGTALAIDPGDIDSIYVGMGKGGIFRIDLTMVPPGLTKTQLPVTFAHPLEDVRDITVVRAALPGEPKPFLYGALSYGQIFEYDLTSDPPSYNFRNVGCGYPERIAAVTDGGSNALLAVALNEGPGAAMETHAPYTKNGIWSDICLKVGIDDPDAIPQSNCSKVKFFKRDLASAGQPTELSESIAAAKYWGSLILRRESPTDYRCYLCTSHAKTQVHSITNPFTTPQVQLLRTWVGSSFGGQEGTPSLVNPEVFRFSNEGGQTGGSMLHIAPSLPYAITPIPGTTSVCIPDLLPPDCVGVLGCAFRDPIPWHAGLVGEAHWLDPSTPLQEWFLAGGSTSVRIAVTRLANGNCNCTFLPECGGDPCNPTPILWQVDALPNNPLVTVGFKLVRLSLPSTGSTTGSQMQMRWYQVAWPVDSAEKSQSAAYAHTERDPRDINGYPAAVYCVRGGSDRIKAFRPEELIVQADVTCPGTHGFGESIQNVSHRDAVTHVELEEASAGVEPCVINVPCSDTPAIPRNLHNNRSELFEIQDSSANSYFINAVAAGFPTAAQNPLFPASPCHWQQLYGLPMLVTFNVTATGSPSFGSPRLLRVGLGTQEGHAFAVRTKTYGSGATARTYAFVGDILGRLYVFNVSYDKLFPRASTPYLPGTEILPPVGTPLEFPKDPHDGRRTNLIDLELDGDFLYCALGRAGLGIVDVSQSPTTSPPVLCAVLDTPGLVLGLAIRTLPGGQKQVVAGDSLGGVRVYQ